MINGSLTDRPMAADPRPWCISTYGTLNEMYDVLTPPFLIERQECAVSNDRHVVGLDVETKAKVRIGEDREAGVDVRIRTRSDVGSNRAWQVVKELLGKCLVGGQARCFRREVSR